MCFDVENNDNFENFDVISKCGQYFCVGGALGALGGKAGGVRIGCCYVCINDSMVL